MTYPIETVETFLHLLLTGKSLLVVGKPGDGKHHLCSSLLKEHKPASVVYTVGAETLVHAHVKELLTHAQDVVLVDEVRYVSDELLQQFGRVIDRARTQLIFLVNDEKELPLPIRERLTTFYL